jgi:hypothetical protein
LLHLECQTVHRQTTLTRFLLYDAYLYERHQRPIHTVVFYGPQVTNVRSEIIAGALHYRVVSVLLGQEDGEATYRRLHEQVARGSGLTAEERLDLVFLPMMRHQRAGREVLQDALTLTLALPEQAQQETVAALIGLGHHFLTESELDVLLEGLMTTSIGQRLIEQGIERGIEQGIERGIEQGIERGTVQARQHDVVVVLTGRFGTVPSAIVERIGHIEDAAQLEALLSGAATTPSLDEFVQALG